MARAVKPPVSARGRTLRVVGLAARVGASYGRSLISRTLGLSDEESQGLVHSKNAARILETAVMLRGPFMKLVQMLAMQNEILPEAYLDALSTVHDKAPPLPWEDVRPVLLAEFGKAPEEVFAHIDPRPIAAASLGQVYRGELHSGNKVAIKVQYPGVAAAVEKDLKLFGRLIKAQNAMGGEMLGMVGYKELFADLESRLREELDYHREAHNIELFRLIYEGWEYVRIPRVYREYSTGRVLTMDLLEGDSLVVATRQQLPYADRERLVRRLYEMALHEFDGVGVFHADPHPGNKLIDRRGNIALLDFGCVKVLPKSMTLEFRQQIQAIIAGDDQALLNSLCATGIYRDGLDPAPILAEIKFINYPLLKDADYDPRSIDFGRELMGIATATAGSGYRHVPPESLFLLRSFLGMAAMFRAMQVNTINFHQMAKQFLAARVGDGDRLRAQLEQKGLIREHS